MVQRPDYESVMGIGRAIDLTGCAYGDAQGRYVTAPHGYYHFLAGLVRANGFTRILEIGTHYGGAALAMSKGIGPAADSSVGRIVTVDIVRQGEAATADVPAIVRIRGHSLAPTTIREVCSALEDSGRAIDLLFVDSRHERRHTLENIAVYANRLKPKVIAIDDVNLTNGMRRLWNEVVGIGAGDATDVSKLVDRVSAGFGVIECRYPFHWPELNRLQRASLRVLERGHDRFGPRLPPAVKHALSRFVPR